ncbi:hypothetical protein [Thermohalobacter berrensis]|uniref:DUF3899 domain-containing protein n=1 Tax=Thermohalobacter berrensis TaxID=99594 RepID=A0A419SZ76_9FIRM|nr:hypothetical protein [Thermohalobacter berrensis]RKD30567.1 hypothetical protein BET03_04315 [Thermohalobacter berrensis]
MAKKKERLIRSYYFVLSLLLVLYIALSVTLNYFGYFSISNNKFTFFVITFTYYLIVKNLLVRYYKNKIFQIEPQLKKKDEKKKQQIKSFVPEEGEKWYKNVNLMYIIGIIIVVLLFSLFGR